MAKRKACKSCKIFYDGSECPSCKSTLSSTNWKGRIAVINVQKSEIAKKVGLTKEGEYAIKV